MFARRLDHLRSEIDPGDVKPRAGQPERLPSGSAADVKDPACGPEPWKKLLPFHRAQAGLHHPGETPGFRGRIVLGAHGLEASSGASDKDRDGKRPAEPVQEFRHVDRPGDPRGGNMAEDPPVERVG